MYPYSLLELFPYLNNPSSITSLLAEHTHPITTTQVTRWHHYTYTDYVLKLTCDFPNAAKRANLG